MQNDFLNSFQELASSCVEQVRAPCQKVRLSLDRYLEKGIGENNHKKFVYELIQLFPIGLAFALAPGYVQTALSISSCVATLFFANVEQAGFYRRKNFCISGLCCTFSAVHQVGLFLIHPSLVLGVFLLINVLFAAYCLALASPKRSL